MALTPKKNVNLTASTQAPLGFTHAPTTEKTIDPEKVSIRMRKIIEAYPERHRHSITAILAAMIVDIPIAIFEENIGHDMIKMVTLFHTKVVADNTYDRVLFMRDRSLLSRVANDSVMSIMLPSLPPFSDVDSLFRNPYPVPVDVVIKHSSIRASAAFADKLEFENDAKLKFMEIATTLQSQLGDDFAPQRMYLMIPLVRAVAFINGHKKVAVEDLGILDCSWSKPARRDEFVSVVDGIVSNFSGIAEQFRNKLARIRTRYSQARSAVSQNQSPNYWDDTIPTNWSLDDVIVNCINDTSEVEAELLTLTDGKLPTNKSHAPLFAVLEEAKGMKKTFAQSKGIKVS